MLQVGFSRQYVTAAMAEGKHFRCQETGHIARNCPSATAEGAAAPAVTGVTTAPGAGKSTGGTGRNCYTCGKPGHTSAKCFHNPNRQGGGAARKPAPAAATTNGEARTKSCYNCSSTEHIARDCPEPRQESQRPAKTCRNCGAFSHLARECPEPRQPKACHSCGALSPLIQQVYNFMLISIASPYHRSNRSSRRGLPNCSAYRSCCLKILSHLDNFVYFVTQCCIYQSSLPTPLLLCVACKISFHLFCEMHHPCTSIYPALH